MRGSKGHLFFSCSLGFVLGVAFSAYIPLSFGVVGFIALLIILFLGGMLLYGFRGTHLIAIVLCIGFLVGGIRGGIVQRTLPSVFVPLLGTTQTVTGTIFADPDIRETSQRITVAIEREGVATNMLAVAPLYPSFRYGDEVSVKGMITLPEAFETDGGRTFRYDSFLAKDGIFIVIPNAEIEFVHEAKGVALFFGTVLEVKHSFLDALAQSLPEPESALAQGILVGGKQGLGEKILDLFIVTGLIHVVVLSGYNVMIVAEAIRNICSVFPKYIANGLAGVAVLFFVLVSGAGAASIRAGLMATIGLFARATGRTYDAVRALVFAGVVMLLGNPLLLLDDPGFQLSFVATLGLIVGAPLFERWLVWIKSIFLREILASTLAAQIAVLPLLLYQTGILSVVSLPANIFVLPLVPLGMATAAIAAVGAFLIPPLAPLLGLPAFAVLWVILFLTEFFASLPFNHTIVPAFPLGIVFVSYGFLFFLYLRITRQPFSPRPRSN